MSNILKKRLYNNKKFTSILETIKTIEDPRRTSMHPFVSLVMIMICAHICGKYGGIGIAAFANNRIDWLKEIIDLPFGAPSHDTFTRLINKLHPDELTKILEIANKEAINIDSSDDSNKKEMTVSQALDKHMSIDGKVIRTPSSNNPATLVRAYHPKKNMFSVK